jgi:hypothetical protein
MLMLCGVGNVRRYQEQRYFEQRAMFGGVAPGMGMFDGYRKCEDFPAAKPG